MNVFTLKDLQSAAGRKVVQAAVRRVLISDNGTYQEFVNQLYQDIDERIHALQASRELRQRDSEDRITQDILMGLNQHGYQATHDTKSGGHVDLSVRLGDHSWIGEAKKDGQFDEGLKQLTSRFVQPSGNFAHDHGGLLFYMVTTANAKGSLDGWRKRMTDDGHKCWDCKSNPLAFYSMHKLKSPGTCFTVRNMAVSLFHKPIDRSARISDEKRAAKKQAVQKKVRPTLPPK